MESIRLSSANVTMQHLEIFVHNIQIFNGSIAKRVNTTLIILTIPDPDIICEIIFQDINILQ